MEGLRVDDYCGNANALSLNVIVAGARALIRALRFLQ